MEQKTHWLINSQENKEYSEATWYRCHKIEEFVNLIEENDTIVGITFEGNNIGFILEA